MPPHLINPDHSMHHKYIALLLTLASAALCLTGLTGCDTGRAQMGPREANFLGIAKVERESYTPTGPNTFAVHTDEILNRKNFSGDKVTLFWGLVTLKDY